MFTRKEIMEHQGCWVKRYEEASLERQSRESWKANSILYQLLFSDSIFDVAIFALRLGK